MAITAAYLSAAENESEPDGDDDDGAFSIPSHPNIVPTTTSNIPIIFDSQPNTSNFGPQAQQIADSEAGAMGTANHVTWQVQTDGSVVISVQSADGSKTYNALVINTNGETDNTTLLPNGDKSSTYSYVGADSPDVPWQTQNTDPNNVPTGDLIRNAGGSEAEIKETDVNGVPTPSDAAFYNQNGDNEVGVPNPNVTFSTADTDTIVADSTMYGVTQSLDFLKDDLAIPADQRQYVKEALGSPATIANEIAKDPKLAADVTQIENDYRVGANPTNDLDLAGMEFSANLLAAVSSLKAALAPGVIASIAAAGGATALAPELLAGAAVIAGSIILKSNLEWAAQATSNYMNHIFDQVYDRNGGVPEFKH